MPALQHRTTRVHHRAVVAMLAAAISACAPSSPPAPPPEPPPPTIAAVDTLVADAMRDGKVPGLAITIVRGDSIIHSRGYGFANLAEQRAMTDTTPVVIGSTSKTFTAFAIMQLADEGKVALDSTVPHYVTMLGAPASGGRTAMAATPADQRFRNITVRHLLTNVGGIPAGFAGDPFEHVDTSTTALEEYVRDEMLPRPLDFAPGTGYKYSNRGFSLASFVVQEVSGESYEDYVARHIFQPLGMRHSTGRFWEGPSRGIVQGYRESVDGKPLPRPAALGRAHTGSGMILSTSRDAAKFLRVILNGGRAPDGQQLLSQTGAAELIRPQQKAESELGGPTTYALAWELHGAGGVPMFLKGGSVISMGSLFVMLPEQKVGIAFVFNDVDYGLVQLLQNLVKYLLGAPTGPYQGMPAAKPVPPSSFRASPAALRAVAGDYMTKAGLMRVAVRGDTLMARYEADDIVLEPAAASSFITRSVVRELEGVRLDFRKCGSTMCLWSNGDSTGIKR